MNDSPVSALEQKKDRRGLLALIGAGGAAAVAALLTRSNGAQAHGDVEGTSATGAPGVHGKNSIWGPGVQGNSETGSGVYGGSNGGYGVYGYSAGNTGVRGGSSTGYGVLGFSGGGYGVLGISGNSDGLRAARTSIVGIGAGVQGFSGVDDTDAPDRVGGRFVGIDAGVRGEGKYGVRGSGKWAVLGTANSAGGAGVFGKAGSGATGVYASATGTKAALRVGGRAAFKQSGKITISAGSFYKVVPLGFTLASGSLVVATLQNSAGGGVAVRYAARHSANKIKIVLTKKAPQSATIAYFIFTP